MNRKSCLLLYSDFSPACKKFISDIEKLPYDFPAVTGLTLLCIDHPEIRQNVLDKGIKVVPSIIVHYYNGETLILEGEQTYKLVESINKLLNTESTIVDSPAQETNEQNLDQTPSTIKKETAKSIMDLAQEMQKSREEPTKRTVLI